jgi:hypothetical protein
MQKQFLKEPYRRILMMDIKNLSKSWQPVIRNDWIIKFSIYRGNILLMFTSIHTGQTIVRFFTDEDDACEKINWVISQDPSKEIPHF